MKIDGKLQAFTIIEVTVAMLLAAISIAIAYTSYRVVGSSYRQFDQKNKKLSEFVLIDKLLKKDVSFCSKMIKRDEGMSLVMPQGEIRYSFYPDYILRNQYNLRNDTLLVRSAEVRGGFEREEVFAGEMMDKVSFNAILEDKVVELSYVKEYSAEELFE